MEEQGKWCAVDDDFTQSRLHGYLQPCTSDAYPFVGGWTLGLDMKDDDPPAPRVVFLDWDDTIYPSTFLSNNGFFPDSVAVLPTKLKHKLQDLDMAAERLLYAVVRRFGSGNVYIITNAETGWVELSSASHLPRVARALSALGIPVISARSAYEAVCPGDGFQWKSRAFLERIACMGVPDAVQKHVISIGDSDFERQAVLIVAGYMPNTVCKSIKFMQGPGLEHLILQVDGLRCFVEMLMSPDPMDVEFVVDMGSLTVRKVGDVDSMNTM